MTFIKLETEHGSAWVNVAGEQYPCKPDIFAATYEAEL